MFTGIVQAKGELLRVSASASDRDLVVGAPNDVIARLSLGASIALDGVCQTVTRISGSEFEVHAIAETLRVTTLGTLDEGSELNLETSLGAGDPLGGHFVQGHVDGMAKILSTREVGESIVYRFEGPEDLVRQLVPKGSVAIDGISLTVGPEIGSNWFEVHLIPHTLEVTTLGRKSVGDAVNIETDILGKYILRFLDRGDSPQTITWDSLKNAGFGESSMESQ